MKELALSQAFTLIEPGPVVWVTTRGPAGANVMTISWTMVMDFQPTLAITTGPWNHSYVALKHSRECVVAIPTADMIDQVVGVGMCSGSDTDKFEKFGLTLQQQGRCVKAPLILECLANIECRVVEMIERHHIIVLEGLAAWINEDRHERRMLHAVGDGTFIVDGERLDRRQMMAAKIPPGV